MTLSHIDFAAALGRRRRLQVSLPAALLGTVAVALLGGVSWQLWSVESRHVAAHTQIELAQQTLRARQAKPAPRPVQVGRDEAVAVNHAIRQLNLPWPQIFDAVERATPEAIAVLSLTPESTSETLTVIGESQTTDSMLAYVRALKAQPLFEDVSVARHEINDKDPHKPIRFEVAARWRPQR